MTQAFKMELDCLAHILFNLLIGLAGGNTTIEVGRIGGISSCRFFNNN